MKTEFFNVIFSNEFRACHDDLNAWTHDWVLHECFQKARIMRKQGCVSVMFLTEIVSSTILWPFQATEIKLNTQR